MDEDDQPPVLTAVSSSARQLYLLLRCINFSDKVHVQITAEGLKFSVDEASVMEGSAFIDRSLFTTYTFHPIPISETELPDSGSEDEAAPDPSPSFQISLPSLLETLQILGLTDPNNTKPPWARDNPSSTAFSNNVLGINNMCRISYPGFGAPLSIILTESTIRTTCALTTYEPDFADDIPFDRQSLSFKTIMRGSWLSDAISELASTAPERLTLIAKTSKNKPYFALAASGSLGSARVEFNNKSTLSGRAPPSSHRGVTPDHDPSVPTNVLETFQLSDPGVPLKCSYKFSLIQKAARAMSIATKVSIRMDTQGVLSLQFMIEVEGARVSFVDFRFVPLLEDENEDDTYIAKGDDDSGTEVEDAAEDEEMG